MDLVFGDSEGTQISDDREGTQISDSDSDSDAEGNDAIVHKEEDYTESDNHDDCDFLKTPNSLLHVEMQPIVQENMSDFNVYSMKVLDKKYCIKQLLYLTNSSFTL